MSIIRKARLYFWPPQRKWHAVPKQTITPYDFDGSTEEERLVMMAGRARSPMEARLLMRHYQVDTAAELIHLLPRPKRRTFMARLHALLARLDGSAGRRRQYIKFSSVVPITIRLRRKE